MTHGIVSLRAEKGSGGFQRLGVYFGCDKCWFVLIHFRSSPESLTCFGQDAEAVPDAASKNVEETSQDAPEDEFGAKDFRQQMKLKLGW